MNCIRVDSGSARGDPRDTMRGNGLIISHADQDLGMARPSSHVERHRTAADPKSYPFRLVKG
jgi:hypothetical protein